MEYLKSIGETEGDEGYNQVPQGNPQQNQYLYLQIQTTHGQPLTPTLFTKDVIEGMVSMQGHVVGQEQEPPLEVMMLSETEAVIEFSSKTNIERIAVWMSPLQYWLGQKIQLVCRQAAPEEVGQARRHEEEAERESMPDTQETRLIRMMEDIHRLAVNPGGEALRIQTFSGSIPPNKNETTFAQWIHEVREAQGRNSEATVRNWINRSLRGPPAELVRSMGSCASVAAILQAMEGKYGAVAPLDVMMKKLFSLSQGKTESVTNFAIRLESTLANIQRDHPTQVTRIQMDASQRDRFFQGLKKVYRDSLRYLYDTGSPYQAILTAARKAEAEVEHYKESEPASAKGTQAMTSEVMEELAAVKAIASKAWGSQQEQKKGKSGDPKKGNGKPKDQQKKGPGACYGCGGTGHFIRECPNPHKKSLNSKGGSRNQKTPPAQKKDSATSTCRGPQSRRRYYPSGWARTVLEPEVTIFLNDAPFDALIDMNSDYSMIDSDLCRYLHLDVTPFQYDIPLCMGLEGACMTKSILAILGWVTLEIGIASLGLVHIRLWVADTVSCKGAPFILGSNQIKGIFNQVNTDNVHSWPQPWKSMYYRFFCGNLSDSDDLYDSDDYDTEHEEEDSFEALCRFESQNTPSISSNSLDSWLKQIEYSTAH